MVAAHNAWIAEPVKRGLSVPGTDGRALMASGRVREARREQLARRPATADPGASGVPARARELCVAPTLVAQLPSRVAPSTASAFDFLGAAGRHARPRPHTSGGSNLPHGMRASPLATMQPHVHTIDFRTNDVRDTTLRRVGTPTDRRRAEWLENGHRARHGYTPGKQLASAQFVDLAYRSVCRHGRHWRDESLAEPVRGKTYVLLHEAGTQRVLLDDLDPALWGAPSHEITRRATVYCASEPGVTLFKREWGSTYGSRGRLSPGLFAETFEQMQHRAYRTATTFDGGLAFTASNTLRRAALARHEGVRHDEHRPRSAASADASRERLELTATLAGPEGPLSPTARPASVTAVDPTG
ncbi:hypothetical protein KFE25_013851 [Diacronema lutheri]|uniref:Uncharacterized protein n=1 Tax=Diacronema lutheri TaxID=2081491 RepID=A0A8J5XDQ3_DIALT|nr:hypothetical protein KFE25_013851 [Diacronema lutheri]